jgi:hypothetical protein
MDMYTNDSVLGRTLKPDFKKSLDKFEHATMATGYIGESFLREIKPKLCKQAKRGSCRLLVGMVFHEGVSQKQKDLLTEIHDALQIIDPQSGVFLTRKQYHGKVYHFESDSDSIAYLGSSNLSDYGFYRRLECSIQITDSTTLSEIKTYLEHLFSSSTTNKLDEVDLKVKRRGSAAKPTKPSNLLKSYEIKKADFDALTAPISDQQIELRVDAQPNSSLNLFYDKGRKNKAGIYAPRPWYEVEITTSLNDRADPNYPPSTPNSSSSSSRTGSFNAFIREDGKYFKIQMKVHSDYGKNISSASGSGGRETLGRYLKGKLESASVLRKHERITSDILDAYGRDYITLKKIDNSNYILDF